ncbi:MAG: hypothetical protein IOD05_01615 [Rhodobacter sp.]|nr:hypothetical protein [Rhodobacter sp.]MCA3493309.1 hypothetical protein [Rhodobacter sp.]MCA3499941.1 hypothetical protein [Rhodobacter sp.]MCA3501966.1 hypothetical protein [Rhodobacter sp.]MCA3515373.1 hypothetical protein [Rhodobacter sp.]
MALKVSDRPKVEKLDAVVSQLEAAIYLTLKGFKPEPIHTLIWASRTVLRDIHKVRPNTILAQMDEAVAQRVKPEFLKEWKQYVNRAANFFKHADKDPNDRLEGVDLVGINAIELLLCILATSEYLGKIPTTLAVGLMYAGYNSGEWFDFQGYCETIPNGPEDFEFFERMNEHERRLLMLKAFEILHN